VTDTVYVAPSAISGNWVAVIVVDVPAIPTTVAFSAFVESYTFTVYDEALATSAHDTAILFSSPAGALTVGAAAPPRLVAAMAIVKLEVDTLAPDESSTETTIA
jgi:hypothetical protein